MSSNNSVDTCPLSSQSAGKSEKSNQEPERVGCIVHRNRGQPIPDSNEPAINQIKFYLDRYKIKEALQVFYDEDVLRLLRDESDFMWDIIPLICKRLRGLCHYRFRVFEGCERMLYRIAIDANCNPKEALISFLAELTNEDDNVFRAMIRPLKSVLLRMNHPSPRDENLRWVINILIRHINNITIPQEFDFDNVKRSTLSTDPTIKRFSELLPLILTFIESFNEQLADFDYSSLPILTESQLDGVLNGELIDEESIIESNHSVNISVEALMSLMSKPLTFLDLTNNCFDLKIFANQALNTIIRMRPNIFSPIYKRLCDYNNEVKSKYPDNCDQQDESTKSLACCAYLFLCERVSSTEFSPFIPLVITHKSLLFCHIPYIITLLKRTEFLAHEKGLALVESLISSIEADSLDYNFFESIQGPSINKLLFHITIFSSLSTSRRKAYELFSKLCDLSTYECKFKILRTVLGQSDLRPCIRASCIDLYRKYLTCLYREHVSHHQIPENDDIEGSRNSLMDNPSYRSRYMHLGGQSLVDFLNICTKACLPDSQHTDIIENYELILATLTMLRFLKLRRKNCQDEIEGTFLTSSVLKKSLFDPVRSAISLITRDLKESPEASKPEELDCLNWALCRLDLVGSVLSITCDLYDC